LYCGHEVAYESKVTTKCPEILAIAMIASNAGYWSFSAYLYKCIIIIIA